MWILLVIAEEPIAPFSCLKFRRNASTYMTYPAHFLCFSTVFASNSILSYGLSKNSGNLTLWMTIAKL